MPLPWRPRRDPSCRAARLSSNPAVSRLQPVLPSLSPEDRLRTCTRSALTYLTRSLGIQVAVGPS
jgi:hypothetical protein